MTKALISHASGDASEFKYCAFISYSHEDEEWGHWLHKAIERYRVPRALVGRSTPRGNVPRRLFPVFRDRDELPGSSSLDAEIHEALRQSRFLLVVCSPKSAVSKWVNEETRTFKALGREDRVLALVVDGEPGAGDRPDSGRLEAFPPALRYRVDANGHLTAERTEPLAADLRKGKDGRRDALLKLLAGLLSVGYDELRQRDRRQRIWQRVRRAVVAAAFVSISAGLWFGIAAPQRRIASSLALSDRAIRNLDVDPLRALVLAVEANRRAHTYEAQYALRRAIRAPHLRAVLSYDGVVDAVFSPDSRRILTTHYNGMVCIWDVNSKMQVLTKRVVVADKGRSVQASFSSDGRRIVTLRAGDDIAEIWDAASGGRLATTPRGNMEGAARNSAFSPDGRRLVTATKNRTARILDYKTRQELAVLRGHEFALEHASFSLDVSLILTASWEAARVWDADLEREFATMRGHLGGVRRAMFSPDGHRIVTASEDRTARIWDAASGRELLALRGHVRGVRYAAYSFDGLRVVTTSEDGTARIWDPTSGRELAALRGHRDAVDYPAFSKDGGRVVTASRDSSARIWDADSGKELAVLQLGRAIYYAAFTESGSRIMTASADQALRFWSTVSGEESTFMPDNSAPLSALHSVPMAVTS